MSSRDQQAIRNLIYRYGDLLDRGDFAAVGALFEHAALDSQASSNRWNGADDVRRMLEATVVLYDGSPRTEHVFTNVIIDIDGDRARAHTTYTVMQAAPDRPLQPVLVGAYLDTFERVDHMWRFATRRYVASLVGDLSAHTSTGGVGARTE